MQLTKHDTNDDVDARNFDDHVAHMHCACTRIFPQSLMIHRTPRFSLSTSTSSSCLSPSSSSTSSGSLSSTTRSSWQTCAAPLQKRVTTPTTSPPPSQVICPTSWPSASSTTHQSPSPSWSRPRTKTWMTWYSARCSQRHTEDKSNTVYQEACQSVVVVCNVQWIRATWWRENGRSLKKIWCHIYCSQQHPMNASKLSEWSIDQGNLISVTARSHRLGLYLKSKDRRLSRNIAKKSVITNSKQLTPKKSVDSYKDNYGDRNWNFVKLINKVLQKFQSSTFDTIARRKFIEDQNTIMELSGRAQELQNEVNCMNDSKDFQDAESLRSGNSHVTSRPMSFPPHPIPEGMLRHSFVSPSRNEGPPSICDTHGISGNVFADPHASSSAPYPQELHQCGTAIEDSLHMSTAEKSEIPEHNQDLRRQWGPSAKDSVIFSGGDSSKNYGADQQRLKILDLRFDKFPTPATFACWKIRFKTEVCTCSQFPTEAMQWIKEVELVDSVDALRSSSSTRGISMPNFEVLDARIASALNKIIHNSHFKRKISLKE